MLLGYMAKGVDMGRGEKSRPVIYNTSAFSSKFGTFNLLKTI